MTETGRGRRGAPAGSGDALEKSVYEVLSERFDDSAISGVRIMDDVDDDGDSIVRIMVIMSGDQPLEGKQLVGLVRHLRSRMSGTAFPIMSFVSKRDAGDLAGAAA